jgi:mono/diheme cytochrome c family protein
VKLLVFFMAATLSAQVGSQITAQGEKIFNQSCATGYCHALRGGSGGGAPRLEDAGSTKLSSAQPPPEA